MERDKNVEHKELQRKRGKNDRDKQSKYLLSMLLCAKH